MIEDIRHRYEQQAYTPSRPAEKLGWAIHHSVSGWDIRRTGSTRAQELAHLDAIARYHLGKFNVEFGYHVAVFPSGRGYLCGDYDTMRAHVCRMNHRYLGLVFIGTANNQSGPTTAAYETAGRIIAQSGLPVIGGHREIPRLDSCPGTACPGSTSIPTLKGFSMVAGRLSPELLPVVNGVRQWHELDAAIGKFALALALGKVKPLQIRQGRHVYELELEP